MGMVTFHLTKDRFGQVQIIDGAGLADRRLTSCSLTRELPRYAFGIQQSYNARLCLVERTGEAVRDSQTQIIFEVGAWLRRNGNCRSKWLHDHVLPGRMVVSDSSLAGAVVPAMEFIALRDDLLDAVQGIEPLYISFPSD